jgi:hypothetical protein
MSKYEKFFNEIANQLDLTNTEEKTIVNSYEAVGKFLNESKYLIYYGPHIFPQGSMRIGTTAKPLKKDDYDIDLVCELTKNVASLSPKEVKHLVGTSLKFSKYLAQLEEEHGRCWTLQYSANPSYHLDILPGISKIGERINATKKERNGEYVWLPTNPKGFAEWFLGLYKHEHVFDEKIGVESVNLYGKRNPIQRAVQLIKRHRDVYFQNRKEDGPASIIITTLTGLSYNNETTIEDILRNGPITWVSHIKKKNGRYIINVPMLQDDNYADKWNNEDKEAANLFFEWHSKLIFDLDRLFAQKSEDSFLKVAKEMFLAGTIDKIINESKTIHDSLKKAFSFQLPMATEDTHPLFSHALPIKSDKHIYVPRGKTTIRIKGRVFATEVARKNNTDEECLYDFSDYSPLLSKELFLRFTAIITNSPDRYHLRWQVTNTGKEASKNGTKYLRGGFEYSEKGISGTKYEHTAYSGTHFVQAFLIDNYTGNCVAKSNILTINIGDDK